MDTKIYIHTNIPAPYRKHQFEAITKEFPNTMIVFYDKMHSDRTYWSKNLSEWKIKYKQVRVKISLPKIGVISPGLLPLLIIQKRGSIHFVGDCHGNWLLIYFSCLLHGSSYVLWNDGGFADKLTPRYKRIFARFFAPNMQFAFTPGEIGRRYCEYLGIKEDGIYNAYFSHDVDEYKKYYLSSYRIERDRIRSEHSIKKGSFVILTVSRYIDWKRLVDLGVALKDINDDYSIAEKIEVILIGEGECHDHEVYLESLDNIKVHHLNRVDYDEMKAFYCASDIMVFPSEGDIWGLVVNEALSLGLPTICTDRIGASELIINGINGYKIPCRSPKAIAEKVRTLATDSELLLAMKKNALSIWDQWNTDFMVAQVGKIVSVLNKDQQ